jgi:hypothetical protein
VIISSLKINITPTQKYLNNIRLDGYANRINYASGIHDDIYLRILHLKDRSKNIVLASLELVGVNNLWQKSAERIVNNSVITATHTHSAPRICHDYLMWGLQCNEYEIDYLNYINNTLSSSLSSALMNQAVSSHIVNNIFFYETEITSICRNRDNPRESSKVKAYIINDDNDIPFILYFPCHSTVLGFDNTYISGDLIGYVVSQLERESKNVVLPLIGAAGDISTRYTRVKQDFSEVERLGNQIIDLVNNRKRLINEIAVKEINYKTIDFLAKTRKNILINILNGVSKSDIVRDYELNAIMNTLKVLPEKVSVKIGLLAFNKSLLFVFIPFEPTYDVQLLLNEHTHDKVVLLVGYSYDYLGYLTSQEESFTYENLMTFVHFNEIFNKIINLIRDI